MDNILRAIDFLKKLKKYSIDRSDTENYETAISAMQELQQYRERIEQLKKELEIKSPSNLPEPKMTLNEAIQHCHEKTDRTACREQHRQLGGWPVDIQRAIETLKNEKGRIVFGISNEVLMNEREMKFVEDIDIAVSAIQELQAYRATGLTPHMVETLKENDKRSHRLAVQRAAEADEYSENCQRWKNEARIQAAAAGELKIALTKRLEEIKIRKAVISDLAQSNMSDMNKVVQKWKIKQFEEQEQWLETLLGSGERERQSNLPPNWQKQMMDKFTERR